MLAILGSLALVAFAVGLFVALRRARDRTALWVAAPLLLGAVTFLFGGRAPRVHRLISLLTVGVALRNAWELRGLWLRVPQLIGALCWLGAIALANFLFG